MSPLAYLCLALALALPATYGTMKVLEARRVQAAFNEGKTAGAAAMATAGAQSATETVAALHKAEAETEPPADKKAVIDLCKRRASCRDRGSLR